MNPPAVPSVPETWPLSSLSVLLSGSAAPVPSKAPVSAPFVPVLLVNPTSGPVPVKLVAASRTR